MATVWEGDATAVAQVNTATLAGSWAGDGSITTTLTAEDGTTTQTVVTSAPSSTIETNRDAHLADLQASAQSLFAAIAWTASSTDAIVATAKIAGVPFYIATTETDSTGTISDAATTANAGPNDFNTAANWSGGSVPADGETVLITQDAPSILFGLDQSSTDLNALEVGPAFQNQVGDNVNGYYLKIDVSNTSPDTPVVRIDTTASAIWISGILDNVNVRRLPSGSELRLDGTIDNLRATGAGVLGRIYVADSADLDNVYNVGTRASVFIGENVTSLDIIESTSGYLETDSGGASLAVTASGGTLILTDVADEAVSSWTNRGAACEYNGGGTLTTLTNYDGAFDMSKNGAAAVTVTNATIFEGSLTAKDNVTFTNNIIAHGGGNVQVPQGVTVSYT